MKFSFEFDGSGQGVPLLMGQRGTGQEVVEFVAPAFSINTIRDLRVIVARATGKTVEDVDWKIIIDWAVELICLVMPNACKIATIIGEVLKQLVDILIVEVNRDPALVNTTFAKILRMEV